jgi:hypothetical protein
MEFYIKIVKGKHIKVYKKPTYVQAKKHSTSSFAQAWAEDLKRLFK